MGIKGENSIMREKQQAPTDDDRYWDALVARLGRGDGGESWSPTVAELVDCERQLAAMPQTPLPDAVVDAIVEDVSTRNLRSRDLTRLERTEHDGRTGGRHDVSRRVPRQRSWPIAMRAAAAVTLTAALTAAVVSLVWPEGTRSHESLDNTQAIELLRRPDQPIESQRAALKVASARVRSGLDLLHRLREPQQPAIVRDAAGVAVQTLITLFSTPSLAASAPAPSDLSLIEAATIAESPTVAVEIRRSAIEQLAVGIGSGIVAIRDASSALPQLDDELEVVRQHVARDLVR